MPRRSMPNSPALIKQFNINHNKKLKLELQERQYRNKARRKSPDLYEELVAKPLLDEQNVSAISYTGILPNGAKMADAQKTGGKTVVRTVEQVKERLK